ncbi:NAD(P)/FAD-dependent oxidoreductase [Rhabdothermincola sp.]|uniref:NAD(P)/FAD-dependent oxidoreductase n=1 Tax=Rhabdothermincola sp. TaxID=2820405 RepID=UPI002FE09D9C
MARVVIIGGGFGGLAAAHELRSAHPELEVTLLDRRDHFFMGFAKLWDLAGVRPLADGTRSLHALERRGVRFVQTEVTDIDAAARRVDTDAGSFDADALLIALGAIHAPAHVSLLDAPGAHDLYDPAALPAMRAELDSVVDGRVLVSILGGPFQCPPAPFEAVLAIDERLRRRGVRDRVEVAISTPQPMTLPVAGVDASRYLASHLGERGIELLAEHAVERVDGAGRTVAFTNGTSVGYAVLLGVPAASAPPVLATAGLTGPSGFVEPDPRTLRTRFDRVYAVGDCTHVPTASGALPKAGVFAASQGAVAARNIAAELLGGERARFDGYGLCFLELPGEQVAFVEGDFLAEPRPEVTLTGADHERYLRKQAFERERLDAWLG